MTTPSAPDAPVPRAGYRSTAGVGALALAVGLTGCSVGVVDTEQSSGSPRANSAAASQVMPPSSVDYPSDPASAGLPTTAAALRARYAGDIARQLDCSGGSVTVSAAGTIVELLQSCDRVTVDGAGVTLFARHIGSLEVNAAASTVLATSIGAVQAGGADVHVYWTSGQPKVSDSGTGMIARRIEEK